MKNIKKLLACLGLTVVCLMAASSVTYAAVAGHVQFVNGDVQITSPAGQARQAQKGDAVSEGDTLTSAPAASAQIKMQDGGIVAMRPDTRLKFDQFVFSGKQDGSEKSFFSLFKGGFRAVTGLIGQINKQNYKITTPAATIGIRGTDHETILITPDSALAQLAPTGAYSKVNVGETTLTTDKGTINVMPNQMGFAGGMNQAPQLQPLNTNIFTVAAAPTAAAKVEKKEEKAESKQEQKSAKSEGNGEEVKKTDDAAAPVRESAAVDANPPAAGTIPPSAAPVMGATAGAILLVPVTTVSPVVLAAGGQTVNLTNQTIAMAGGAPVAITTVTTTATVAPAGTVAAYVQTDLAVAYATLDLGASGHFGMGALISNNTFIAAPADTNNTLPTPFLIDRYAGNGPGSSITHTFSGTTTVGQAATTIAATGIQFGRYDSTQGQMVVVGTSYTGLAPNSYLSGGAVKSHWIVGPAIDPVYLPEVLLTTATYSFAGGTTPTTVTGAAASLNSGSLLVNFTQQLVSLSLALTVGGAPWTANTAATPLENMYWNNAKSGFRAQTPLLMGPISPGWGTLTVACPTCATGTFGTVTGQLTGSGLNGAILSYLLGDGIGQTVAGAAAFTGAAQNTATPYRIAGLSGIDWNPPANVSTVPVPGTLGGYTNAGTVLADAAGNVTRFNASQPFSNGSGITLGIGTAIPAGLGTDPVSGISWGRWVGGALSKTDLASGTVTGLQNTTAAGAALSSHWIASPTLVGPVTLPVTGVFNYVPAGGTQPTDSLGGVGTLNSATLSANFTTQTVALGINVTTPNAGNLIASGTGIPIEQKSMFNASTAGSLQGSNPGSLAVTGSAAGTPQGHIGGAFTGAGGIGAAMIYGLVSGNGVIVNGVTAFHR